MKGKVDYASLPGYKPEEQRKCCMCGKVMMPRIVWEEVPDGTTGANVVKRYASMYRAVRVEHYGYGKENLFCTLTCGYGFACWAILKDKIKA